MNNTIEVNSIDEFKEEVSKLFEEFKIKPYQYQIEASEKIWDILQGNLQNGSVIYIKAPVGAGKTEAVLFPFLIARLSGLIPRLIWVVPNQSILKHLEQRIRNTLNKLRFENLQVRVDHSGLPFSMFWGDIIITTWDSFFYGYSAQKVFGTKYTIPAGNIATSLIVFDEVQMYQELSSLFIPQLINLVLSHFSLLNIPVVVMSATIPKVLENTIFGQNNGIFFNNYIPKEIKKICVLYDDSQHIKRGNVQICLCQNDLLQVLRSAGKVNFFGIERNIYDIINNTLETGKKVLLVLNTVKRAVYVYDILKSKLNLNRDDIILLHSRFVRYDREQRENQISTAKVIVATQVVEAGLDIPDIGLGLFDMCPPDSMIQRAGRVARRPNKEGYAMFFVPYNGGDPENPEILPYAEKDTEVGKKLSKWYKEDLFSLSVPDIKDTNQVQRFLDDFYRDVCNKLHNDIKQGLNGKKSSKVKEKKSSKVKDWHYYLISAYVYFNELSFFAHPPRYVELKARLNSYATLFLYPDLWNGQNSQNQSLYIKVKEKIKKLIDNPKVAREYFIGQEQEILSEVLEKFSVFVSLDVLPRVKKSLTNDENNKYGVRLWISREKDKIVLCTRSMRIPDNLEWFLKEIKDRDILVIFRYNQDKGILDDDFLGG